jgi:hypothetical protein
MPNPTNPSLKSEKSDLTPHWIVVALTLILLSAYIIFCKNMIADLPIPLPESERVSIRTICYGIGIILFPITNLIRHIQLRLNQTMPGTKPAHSRYLLTILVSMFLIQCVGFLGVFMFRLGDDFNTVTILVGMAVLGVFLYRPKHNEYISIVEALSEQH